MDSRATRVPRDLIEIKSPKTQVAAHTSLAVKTAHREYPKACMAGWYAAGSPPNPKREIGSHIILKVLFKRFLSLF